MNAAKAAIEKIAKAMENEVTKTIQIEQAFHKTMIGAGGSKLREIITKCKGPQDSASQNSLIRLYVTRTSHTLFN